MLYRPCQLLQRSLRQNSRPVVVFGVYQLVDVGSRVKNQFEARRYCHIC